MPDINEVRLAGRLTVAPKLETSAKGTSWCRCRIASGRKWTGRDGVEHQDQLFVTATAFDKAAEILATMGKGEPLYVEGKLVFNEWTDKQGGERSEINIELRRVLPLSWKDGPVPHDAPGPQERNTGDSEHAAAITEDDIPF